VSSGAALPLLRPRGRRGGSDRPSVHRASAGLQPRRRRGRRRAGSFESRRPL